MDNTHLDIEDHPMPPWATALAAQVQLLAESMNKKEGMDQTFQPANNSNTEASARQEGKPTKYLGPLATFDGKREELEPWISQVEAKLHIDFCNCNKATQFFMVHNQLRGEASRQLQPWVQTIMGLPEMNPQELIRQLRLSFGDPHCKEKAKRSLHKLHQGKRSFMEYFTEYRKLLLEAGGSSWPDEMKKSFLENGLSMDLQRHMVSRSTGNESFEEYCNELKQTSDRLEAFNLRNNNWRKPMSAFVQPRNNPEAMDWEPTTLRTNQSQVQGRRAKWVAKEVLDYRKSSGLCLRCGNTGHRIANCTRLPPEKPRMLRTNVSTVRAAAEDLGDLGDTDAVQQEDMDLGKD